MAWDFLTTLLDSNWFFVSLRESPAQMVVYTMIVFIAGAAFGRDAHKWQASSARDTGRAAEDGRHAAEVDGLRSELGRRKAEIEHQTAELDGLRNELERQTADNARLREELSVADRFERMGPEEREALAWVYSQRGGKFSIDYAPGDDFTTFRTLAEEGVLVEGSVEDWPDGQRVSFAVAGPWSRWCEVHEGSLPKIGI